MKRSYFEDKNNAEILSCLQMDVSQVASITDRYTVMSVSAVFAFVSYFWYVTGPVSALLNLKMYFARILPSARRLFKFLDVETEEDTGAERIDSRPALSLEMYAFPISRTGQSFAA